MPTSKVIYLGNQGTSATHLQSGDEIRTDAPTDNGGKGEAFSPTDLAATSLGCCMLTIMGQVAERHDLNIKGSTVEITKIMASEPRRIAKIIALVTITNEGLSDKHKTMLENSGRACPVAKSLDKEIVQEITFRYQD